MPLFNGTWSPTAPPSFVNSYSDPYGIGMTPGGSVYGTTYDASGQQHGGWTQQAPELRSSQQLQAGETGGNYRIRPIDNNSFTLDIKNGREAGQQYTYHLDPATNQWTPDMSSGHSVYMRTNSDNARLAAEYGAMLATFAGGGMLSNAMAGGETAGAGAAAAGSQPAYAGVGSSAGAGAGAGLPLEAGGGAAAAGGAAAGGATGATGTTAGSGASNLLSGMSPSQIVQAGTLVGGLIGGHGGSSGPGGSGNPYAGTSPLTPLSQLRPTQSQLPTYGPTQQQMAAYDPNSPSAQMWKQYAGGLMGGGMNMGVPPNVGTGLIGAQMPPQRTAPTTMSSGGYSAGPVSLDYGQPKQPLLYSGPQFGGMPNMNMYAGGSPNFNESTGQYTGGYRPTMKMGGG